MATIAERIKSVIVDQLGVEEDQITSTASFTDDLGADSLDSVDLIMALEQEFNIEIPDDEAEQIKNLNDAEKYIQEKTEAQVSG